MPAWSAPILVPPNGSTTLHFLPHHHCDADAPERGYTGEKNPYCSKDAARAACAAAGCTGGLAEKELLINATYAKRPPKEGYTLGYCARGWVSNEDDLFYWLPEDRPANNSCGPGFTQVNMPTCGGAYW